MAKSDFNVGEGNDFGGQIVNNKKNYFKNNNNNNNLSPEIIYDDTINNSFSGRFKYFLSTINKSFLIFLIFIAIFIFVGIIIVIFIVSSYNKSFKTDVNIPDVVYLGETAAISAISKGTGNVDKTVVDFENEVYIDEDIENSEYNTELALELASDKLTGKEVYNTMIPIQEGAVKITVHSSSGSHDMADVTKNVYVCPRFNSNLATNGIISLVSGDEINIPIDFGMGACSKNIKYKSSNNDIFTVSKEGKIVGVKSGSANLIVTKGERSFSVPVHVTGNTVSMTSFDVSPKKLEIKPGENRRLEVSYLPTVSNTENFKYSVDDSEVVLVDDYGKIIGLKNGTATINVNSPVLGDPIKVDVIVSSDVSKSGSIVTDLEIDKEDIGLVQGESSKINYIISPSDAKDKTVSFSSSNEDVATVTKEGVIFAKKGGDAIITVSTVNSIVKTCNVKVTSINIPIVNSDDGIIANNWHNRDYKLKFSGGGYGATYYYGYDNNELDKRGNSVSINKDGTKLIYSKACIYNLCGPTTSTLVKLDKINPKVLKVVKRVNDDGDVTIYVAASDTTSLISKWCISTRETSSGCRWMNISPIKNPVLSYKLSEYGEYFVFVKDGAGNVGRSSVVSVNGDN